MPQVEARGRLVEQQQARPVRGLAAGELHQHAGEMRALLLAARERGDDAVAERGEIDLGERRSARASIAAAAVARAHAHHLGDRERKRHSACSATAPRDAARARAADSAASARPFSATVPACGASSPASTRSSVDLPAPFGPTSATVSPGATASETLVEQRLGRRRGP